MHYFRAISPKWILDPQKEISCHIFKKAILTKFFDDLMNHITREYAGKKKKLFLNVSSLTIVNLLLWPAPNTNSIRDWFLSVCWQKPFWNNITELSCLGFEFKIFTKPLHFEMVRIRNLCQKKCMKYLVTRFLFCFDFGCQVIFYQTFSSFHFLGTFLEKLSLWLKSKNINSVMVIQNLDQ